MTRDMHHHATSPAGMAAQLAKYEALTTEAPQAERAAQEAIANKPVSPEEVANMRCGGIAFKIA